jgi:hypothetical protein
MELVGANEMRNVSQTVNFGPQLRDQRDWGPDPKSLALEPHNYGPRWIIEAVEACDPALGQPNGSAYLF